MFRKLALTLALLSILVSFYQKEPPPTDILMSGAIASTGLYFLITKKLPQFDWPDRLTLAFLLFNLLQLSTSLSDKALFWVAVTTFLILAYLVLRNLSKITSAWLFFRAYLLAAIINLGLMFLAFTSLYSFNINLPGMTQFGRAQGLFKDPNVAGPFLVPALVYFLDDSVRNPRKWKFVLSGALLAGVFFSFSRGALIATAAALIVWLVIRRREILGLWKNYLVASINLLVILAFIFSYSPFASLAQQRFKLIQGYDVQSRSTSWEAGLSNFSENPSGSGPGSFESGVVESQKETIKNKIAELNITSEKKEQLLYDLETERATEVAAEVGIKITPAAHNTYLRVLTENGIIGITLFLGFVFSVLWLSKGMIFKGLFMEPYQVAMLAAWIGFLANSFVIDTLHWRLFWYLPALLLASLELKRAKR